MKNQNVFTIKLKYEQQAQYVSGLLCLRLTDPVCIYTEASNFPIEVVYPRIEGYFIHIRDCIYGDIDYEFENSKIKISRVNNEITFTFKEIKLTISFTV